MMENNYAVSKDEENGKKKRKKNEAKQKIFWRNKCWDRRIMEYVKLVK